MNNYISLNDYDQLTEDKVINIMGINLLILMFLLVIIGYIFLFIKYDNYYINKGNIMDNKLVTYVKYDDIKYLVNSRYLFFNDKKIQYKIYSISEDNVNYNNDYYKEIKLSINMNNKVNLDNNVIEYKINIYHDRIFNYFFKKIKGDI